jgi:hypothetical protein
MENTENITASTGSTERSTTRTTDDDDDGDNGVPVRTFNIITWIESLKELFLQQYYVQNRSNYGTSLLEWHNYRYMKLHLALVDIAL